MKDDSGKTKPDGALPGDDGGAFDGSETPACIEATVREGGEGLAILTDDGETAEAKITPGASACERTFELSTTQVRRDDDPDNPRVFAERLDRPSLQSGSPMLDALYQLALEEAQENSVAEIKDYAFRNGAALACGPDGCFETGRKWNYVWTRDTAYAVDLGLAWVDAPRARSSLDFKLSTRRDGSDLQIVQDTGTGGSYPVSSDRVVWAIGAREVLAHLSGDVREAFARRALTAIRNTLAHDRAVVFDPVDGLYRGEQSFLDWREQTYPAWTGTDTVEIAQSKSLSTNATHLIAMQTALALAEELGDASVTELRSQESALRKAIQQKFWLPEQKQFSTYLPTTLDAAPVRRFDMLGTALAVLADVVPPELARDAIASYPMLPKGPPVVFPQQQNTPIYHNRSIWPFVTAYAVRAARKVGNDAAFDLGMTSLVRGAALNLSNMENLEMVTGKPWLDDGAASGPVVNSQRQLWSVAAFIGAVNGSLFGLTAQSRGLWVKPFVTSGLRKTYFAGSSSIALNNLPFRGKQLSVVIRMPDDDFATTGAYGIASVKLNGVLKADGIIDESELGPRNLVVVELSGKSAAASAKVVRDVTDYKNLYGPKTPTVDGVALSGGKLTLSIGLGGEAPADVKLAVYRDGVKVASDLPGTTTTWTDGATTGEGSPSHCYTVESTFAVSGNASQHARAACFWGTGAGRITSLPASGFAVSGGNRVTANGKTFYEAWGDEDHQLAATFTASRTGAHLIQANYANGAGGLTTGITCAVKRVTVEELPGGGVVGEGYLVMPQRGSWDSWGDSSFVKANLQAGKSYRVRLTHDARAVNMSAFSHFEAYTGGTGGTGGAFFRVNVAELKVLALVP